MDHSNLFLQTVTDPSKKGWTFKLYGLDGQPLQVFDKNGKPLDLDQVLGQLIAHQSRLGVTVQYGMHPNGIWDQFKMYEKGGGGSVLIPTVMIDGVQHIGLATISRNGHDTQEFPRAFVTPGQTHLSIAVDEARSMCTSLELAIESVGSPQNPNSTWFYSQQGEGVQFFVLRVNPDNLMRSAQGWFVFKVDYQPTENTSKVAKSVLSCDFFPIGKIEKMISAGEITDMFAPAGLKTLEIE